MKAISVLSALTLASRAAASQQDLPCDSMTPETWVLLQAMQAVEGLKTKGDKKAAVEQIKALYQTFVESDCTMVEVRRACSCQGQTRLMGVRICISARPSLMGGIAAAHFISMSLGNKASTAPRATNMRQDERHQACAWVYRSIRWQRPRMAS